MHWFMKFRYGWYKLGSGRNPEVGGPMFHSLKEVDKPLADDVVTEDDQGDGAEVVYHEGCDEVHVGVSA